jgi:hypothetical protein
MSPIMPNEQTLAEQLREFLVSKLGDDWRRDISFTVRADALYWLVYLAERGLAERRAAFKDSGVGASEAASLASWAIDLENLVNRIKSTFPSAKGK